MRTRSATVLWLTLAACTPVPEGPPQMYPPGSSEDAGTCAAVLGTGIAWIDGGTAVSRPALEAAAEALIAAGPDPEQAFRAGKALSRYDRDTVRAFARDNLETCRTRHPEFGRVYAARIGG